MTDWSRKDWSREEFEAALASLGFAETADSWVHPLGSSMTKQALTGLFDLLGPEVYETMAEELASLLPGVVDTLARLAEVERPEEGTE